MKLRFLILAISFVGASATATSAWANGTCRALFADAGTSTKDTSRFGSPRADLRVEWSRVGYDGTGEFFVLYAGKEAVGSLGLHLGGGAIQFVRIRKDFREQGFGSTLYKFVAAKLALEGQRFQSDALNSKSRGVWNAFEKQGLAQRHENDRYEFDLAGFSRAPEFKEWTSRLQRVDHKEPHMYDEYINYDSALEFYSDN